MSIIYYKIITIIEDFLNILIVTVLKLKYVLCKSTHYNDVNEIDTICILGNGPSLSNDLNLIFTEKINGARIMAVNLFLFSELFVKIKPDYYIVQDPAFFKSNVDGKYLKMQDDFVECFITNVNWPIGLIIPPSALKNHKFLRLKMNNNISLIIRKSIPIIGGSTSFNNFLYKNDLATPLALNVLIAAVFEALKMGYKHVNLYGADHSWHENYELGIDNVLYIKESHFYDDSESTYKKPLADEYGKKVRVHEEFFNLYRVFKIYDSLHKFSLSIHAHVKNRSSKTWIDSFDRY